MVFSLKELTEHALQLPIDDRVRLRNSLNENLPEAEVTEADKQLVAQLLRRRDEVRSGAVKGIDGEVVLAEIRRMVGR